MYEDEEPVRCPRCRSTQLTANKKALVLGKRPQEVCCLDRLVYSADFLAVAR